MIFARPIWQEDRFLSARQRFEIFCIRENSKFMDRAFGPSYHQKKWKRRQAHVQLEGIQV